MCRVVRTALDDHPGAVPRDLRARENHGIRSTSVRGDWPVKSNARHDMYTTTSTAHQLRRVAMPQITDLPIDHPSIMEHRDTELQTPLCFRALAETLPAQAQPHRD